MVGKICKDTYAKTEIEKPPVEVVLLPKEEVMDRFENHKVKSEE